MARLDIKHVTVDNWRDPDPQTLNLVTLLPEGGHRPTTNEEWLALIDGATLADTVPDEIHDLFTVARGTMVYGYLFYPLYTVAFEQLFRIAEAAVFHRCRLLGYEEQEKPGKRRDRFNTKLDWLVKQGVLSKEQRLQWDAIRELRNFTSHGDEQMLVGPSWAIHNFWTLTDTVNVLFGAPPSSPLATNLPAPTDPTHRLPRH